MKYPRVLVACPVSDLKRYCFDDWLYNVKHFTYQNFGIYLNDNSDDVHFSRYIQRQGDLVCEWTKPKNKYVVERLVDSAEACRRVTLMQGFDYMLMLECDVFPPPHIIEMLLCAKRHVIGALYHIGNGRESQLMVQVIEEHTSEAYLDARWLGRRAATFLDGTVKRVYHCGLGCILIHKSILEKINFHLNYGNIVKDKRMQVIFPDICFAHDLYNLGIDVFVDTNIFCEHRNTNDGWVNFAHHASTGKKF